MKALLHNLVRRPWVDKVGGRDRHRPWTDTDPGWVVDRHHFEGVNPTSTDLVSATDAAESDGMTIDLSVVVTPPLIVGATAIFNDTSVSFDPEWSALDSLYVECGGVGRVDSHAGWACVESAGVLTFDAMFSDYLIWATVVVGYPAI